MPKRKSDRYTSAMQKELAKLEDVYTVALEDKAYSACIRAIEIRIKLIEHLHSSELQEAMEMLSLADNAR